MAEKVKLTSPEALPVLPRCIVPLELRKWVTDITDYIRRLESRLVRGLGNYFGDSEFEDKITAIIGSLAVTGDEVWIHVAGDTAISHVGPSTRDATKDIASGVSWNSGTRVLSVIPRTHQFDEKGHRSGYSDGSTSDITVYDAGKLGVFTVTHYRFHFKGNEVWTSTDGQLGGDCMADNMILVMRVADELADLKSSVGVSGPGLAAQFRPNTGNVNSWAVNGWGLGLYLVTLEVLTGSTGKLQLTVAPVGTQECYIDLMVVKLGAISQTETDFTHVGDGH